MEALPFDQTCPGALDIACIDGKSLSGKVCGRCVQSVAIDSHEPRVTIAGMNKHAQPSTARFFLLEYEVDGERMLYRDALPARSAFAAARDMATAGLRPKVLRCVITAEQAREIGRERLIR